MSGRTPYTGFVLRHFFSFWYVIENFMSEDYTDVDNSDIFLSMSPPPHFNVQIEIFSQSKTCSTCCWCGVVK